MVATIIKSATYDLSSPCRLLAAPVKPVVVAEATGFVTLWTELKLVSEVGTGIGLVEDGLIVEASVEDSGPVGVAGAYPKDELAAEVTDEHVPLPISYDAPIGHEGVPGLEAGVITGLALGVVAEPALVGGGTTGGNVLLEPADIGGRELFEVSAIDVGVVVGRVVQGLVGGTVGVVAGWVVSTEVAEDDVGGDGDTGGVLTLTGDVGGGAGNDGEVITLLADSGTELWEMTVTETVVENMLDIVSVKLQGVVLGGGVLTAGGVTLVSQEVSLAHGPPGAARAGPMAANRRTVDIIAMICGMSKMMLSGEWTWT